MHPFSIRPQNDTATILENAQQPLPITFNRVLAAFHANVVALSLKERFPMPVQYVIALLL